jgi:hypothetical protein
MITDVIMPGVSCRWRMHFSAFQEQLLLLCPLATLRSEARLSERAIVSGRGYGHATPKLAARQGVNLPGSQPWPD